jgi:hypothetical protein
VGQRARDARDGLAVRRLAWPRDGPSNAAHQ